ncbi:hypothetical protein LZ198_17595 [Myxococcus sp. K15C18031901]|uniref:DUF7151 family protein n=1 Tax=Myxococcus dinghuensis TaxID=2906761 RepID=UPI0020A793B1|nr:hypothetical protein [Myxococcus dinghuensis]MCP3100687.1 hypothetical protein [Myxococcus dinghuensis]
MRWTWGAMLTVVTLMGCDAITLRDIGPKTVSRTTEVPAGETCALGGSKVESGPDWNRDGVLGDAEVATTEVLCNPTSAPILTRRLSEPRGEHCELGGTRVQSGPDTNANDLLDDAEVVTTEFVCAAPPPAVLVTTEQLAPGETCPQGGQTIRAGTDMDGDGVLSSGEVGRELTACMEKAPFLVRAYSTGLDSHGFCPGGSQTLVQAGIDLDEDHALDPGEVRSSQFLCGPASKIRFSWKVTPSSEYCTNEGFAVDAWVDEDGDGEMSLGEVQTALHVCRGSTLLDGFYRVRTSADLAALQAVTHIRGSLIINHSDLQTLELPGLWSIDGTLSIVGNYNLVSLSLPALRFVGDDVEFIGNTVMTQVRLGSIGPTPAHSIWVGDQVKLSGNTTLSTLPHITGLAPQGSFILTENSSLVAPIAFPYVESLKGELVVRDNPALATLPFMNLRTVGGSVTIRDNAALGGLYGLRSLTSVDGDLQVIGNALRDEFLGLESLKHVGGDFWVMENTDLTSLALPALEDVRDLLVDDNPLLESAGPFPRLSSVRRELRLARNAKLAKVTQAPRLSAAGVVTLSQNPLLTDLSAFENVTWASAVEVAQNDALTSLAGFKRLREATLLTVAHHPRLQTLDMGERLQVSGAFYVHHNPQLAACAVTALADAAFTGDPDSRITEGNDETAVCSP